MTPNGAECIEGNEIYSHVLGLEKPQRVIEMV